MNFKNLDRAQLLALREKLLAEYEAIRAQGLSLDLSRGKPCREQLDLSDGLLTCIKDNTDTKGVKGFDYRNYGLLDGIPEAKSLFSALLGPCIQGPRVFYLLEHRCICGQGLLIKMRRPFRR